MVIETVQPTEGLRWRAIRLQALTESPGAFGTRLEECLTWPEERWTQQVRTLHTVVAVLDGVDCGVVRGVRSDEVPTEALLLSMWVAPSVRGRGVGRALVERIVDWARDERFDRMVLEVHVWNAPARALYRRCGFEASPSPSTTEIRMVRELALSGPGN